MTTKKITAERLSLISSKSFSEVLAGIEAAVGRPDMQVLVNDLGLSKTFSDLENVIHKAEGPSGFMEFNRFDLGAILRKENGGQGPKILRLLIGNPLIMKRMVEHVPDAGSYAPVTVLIDERPDGVHLSYDRMSSFLASYGSPQALKVAQDLDSKVEALLVLVS